MAYSISVEGTTVVAETYNECVSLWQLVTLEKVVADDGWIEWNGGEQPVPDETMIQAVLRRESKDDFDPFSATADSWVWSHDNHQEDIVAYRIVP